MIRPRVIPVLTIEDDHLVKTIKFKERIYVGDPMNAIRTFNEKEVDELIVVDITASKEGREPNFDLIKEFSEECFMPLTYGGGVSTMEQAARIFSYGVEKVSLNSKALDFDFLTNLSSTYGSQSIVASVDIKKGFLGGWKVHAPLSKCPYNIIDYVSKLEESGVGEIFLNCVNNDGTNCGYQLEILQKVSESVGIPVIICGGGTAEHFQAGFDAGASAVAAGREFILQGPYKAVLISYPDSDFIESLKI